jgi:hypothetical protein
MCVCVPYPHPLTPTPTVLSGLWVFSFHSLFIAFSSPNIDPRSDDRYDLKAYAGLALSVFGSVVGCFLFMTDTWFRFRCWIKKIPRAVVCRPLDFEALPIEEDMDFDGRGIKNDHPSYMRTKVRGWAIHTHMFIATSIRACMQTNACIVQANRSIMLGVLS